MSGMTLADFYEIREKAQREVEVPGDVIQLITDLRCHLQDRMEPPVYVSDRRLVKAMSLLRVAAYTNGRKAVSE